MFWLVHSQGAEMAFSHLLWYWCSTRTQRSQQLSPGFIYTKGTVESEWNNRISRERCLTEQEPGEYRKIPYHTWKHETCSWGQEECYFSVPVRLFRCSGEGSHPRSIMAAFQQLLSCLFLRSSLRGGADYRLAGALLTQHNTILSTGKVLPFLFSADWFIRTFSNLGMKSSKKNLYIARISSPRAQQILNRKWCTKQGKDWKDPV